MKALSLWQPWASLVMLDVKRVETRSWRPPKALVGERIWIHAAKRIDGCIRLPRFSQHISDPRDAPTGVLLGSVVVEGVWEIERPADARMIAQEYHRLDQRKGAPVWDRKAIADELMFGDFTVGRWAWGLAEVRRLEKPIPYRGGQRLFEVEVDQMLAGRHAR